MKKEEMLLTLSFVSESSEKSAKSAEKSAESTEELTNRHKEILFLMETGQEYSSEEISEMCGLKGSRTRQLLKQLVEMGKLKATADTKNRRYIKKA